MKLNKQSLISNRMMSGETEQSKEMPAADDNATEWWF